MRLSLTFAMIRLDYLIWEMCGALTQSGVDFVWLECILYIELFTKLETKAILSHFIFGQLCMLMQKNNQSFLGEGPTNLNK